MTNTTVWPDNEVRYKQANGLPEGWIWHNYNDGSGHLQSPNGEKYFLYDLMTSEYQKTPDSKYELGLILDGPDSKGYWRYYRGNFKDLERIAVKWITENVLEKEQSQNLDRTL